MSKWAGMEQTNTTQEEILMNLSALNDSSVIFDEDESFAPQWVIYLYFFVVSLGAVVNLLYSLALLRSRRNGTLSLVMQMCTADFLFLYTAAVEVITLNGHTWMFSSEACCFYNGMEMFIHSLTLWLIICLNFHVISLWNLHKYKVEKKNPLTTCGDESNECLVTKKENANRTLNIDYCKRKNDVSTILPTILIWSFCVSLSIPNFTLSLTMKIGGSYTICAIVDNIYGHILQKLFLTLRILLPIPLLIFSLIILFLKLLKTSKRDIDNVLTKQFCEIRSLLVFCIVLTILYIVTSFHRNLSQFLYLISYNFDKNSAVVFTTPPLHNNNITNSKSVYLAMLHYSGATFRVFLYMYLLPKFTVLVKDKIFVCCKKVNK